MLNVDWLKPLKHSLYSVGSLYMVLMNLPGTERFKPFLKPLVAQLNALWENGLSFKAQDTTSAQIFRAALLCVGCDFPAARKVCGLTGHASNRGCSKCKRKISRNSDYKD